MSNGDLSYRPFWLGFGANAEISPWRDDIFRIRLRRQKEGLEVYIFVSTIRGLSLILEGVLDDFPFSIYLFWPVSGKTKGDIPIGRAASQSPWKGASIGGCKVCVPAMTEKYFICSSLYFYTLRASLFWPMPSSLCTLIYVMIIITLIYVMVPIVHAISCNQTSLYTKGNVKIHKKETSFVEVYEPS